MRGFRALPALVALCLGPAIFAQAVSLSVSQTWTSAGVVTMCLYPRAADGLPGKLAAASVSASAANQTLVTQSVTPFEASGEGVAYLLLVDISKSLSNAEFQPVRQAMASFAQGLRPVDRISMLTFGDDVQVKLDFTADRPAIEAAIQSLAPSDNRTKLHLALSRAIELGQRQDPGLPPRRVIVLLTDGKDEGSGLSEEDLLVRLRAARLPIYSIGASRLPAGEKKQFLDWLRRLSANSGGEYFDASPSFAESYETIRKCVMGVLLARFTCSTCQSGKAGKWNITVKDGDKVLTASTEFPLPVGQVANAAGAQQEESPPAPAASRPWWVMPVGAGAVAVLGLAAAIAIMRKKRTLPAREAFLETADTPHEIPAADPSPLPSPSPPKPAIPPAAGPRPLRSDKPAGFSNLCLVVVRGNKPGQAHELRLEAKAKVGTAASCQLVLRSEPSLAPEQFELARYKDKIAIRGITAQPTTVNGVPIHGEHPLRDGDIIGAGGVEFRILVRPS